MTLFTLIHLYMKGCSCLHARKASCITLPVSFKSFFVQALSSFSCYSRCTFSVFVRSPSSSGESRGLRFVGLAWYSRLLKPVSQVKGDFPTINGRHGH